MNKIAYRCCDSFTGDPAITLVVDGKSRTLWLEKDESELASILLEDLKKAGWDVK